MMRIGYHSQDTGGLRVGARRVATVLVVASQLAACDGEFSDASLPSAVDGRCFVLVTNGGWPEPGEAAMERRRIADSIMSVHPLPPLAALPSRVDSEWIGDGIANDTVAIRLLPPAESDSLGRGRIAKALVDVRPADARPRPWWYQHRRDSLKLMWGSWPEWFVVDLAWQGPGYVGRAYFEDDAYCADGGLAGEPCWRGGATLTPSPCGGLEWDAVR